MTNTPLQDITQFQTDATIFDNWLQDDATTEVDFSAAQDGSDMRPSLSMFLEGIVPASPLAGGPARLALAAALPAWTYNNGTAGDGATITANADGAIPDVDGVAPNAGDRIWIWDWTGAGGANIAYGMYTVTQLGNDGFPWILTRTADANTPAALGVGSAYVLAGTANAGLVIQITDTADAITLGTTALAAVVVSGGAAVTAETTRAEAAEAVLSSTAVGLAANIGALQPFLWEDDGAAFAWGVFDTSGAPIVAATAGGKLVGSAADYLNDGPVAVGYAWADDAAASTTMIVAPLFGTGVEPLTDANGNVVIPYGAAPCAADDYCCYINKPDSTLRASDADPLAGGATFLVASTRGNPATGGLSGFQHMGPIIKFVDDATASGNAPLIERRQFDMRAGNYLTNIGGITTLIHVIDIGHSLTVGATAGLLTTAPFFNRGVMFNGGPKVVQNVGGYWDTPAPICADGYNGQMQQLLEYYEFQNSNGQGETHGGGVVQWASAGGIASDESILFSSVGAGGAILANLLSGTTQYSNMVRVAERSAAIAALNGWGWECYVCCSIGENDYTTYAANAAGFQANLIALQAAIQTSIQTIYTANGWDAPTYVPLICEQGSSWTDSVYDLATCALAYVFPALARTYPNLFKLVGPEYYTDNYSAGGGATSVHKTALGYKLDGQYMMRTVQKIRAAAPAPGLYVTGVSNTGTTLNITTSGTTNLAIDTSVVTDPNGQKGLRVLDVTNGNANVALSSIAASGTGISATLAAENVGHTYMLGAGDIGTAGNLPGPTTGPRTCIRDSSADVSSADTDSTPMYNYLSHDQLSWVVS